MRQSIIAMGGEAYCCTADLRSAHDREGVIASALAKTGRIDVLINAAGIGQRGALETVPMDRIRECFEVNVFAALAMIQSVSPIMRATPCWRRYINISSMSGRIARPFSAVYDATKHALEAISDGAREELAPFGVQVIAVQPGYTRSGFSAAADERDPGPGVYESFIRMLRRRDWRRRFAVTPERVAETVVGAVRSVSPRPRYAVPGIVGFMLLLRRVFPDRLFYRLLLRAGPAIRGGTMKDIRDVAAAIQRDLSGVLGEIRVVPSTTANAEDRLDLHTGNRRRSESIHRQVITTVEQHRKEIDDAIDTFLRWMMEGSIVRIVGAGQARLAASIPANRLAHGGARVYVQDDFVPMPHTIRGGGIIAASASGTTRAVLDVMKSARDEGRDVQIVGIAADDAAEFRSHCDIFLGIAKEPLMPETRCVRLRTARNT